MIPLHTGRIRAGLGLALLGLCLGAHSPAHDAKEELQAIDKELNVELNELRQAAKDLDDDEAISAIYSEFEEDILPEFAQRYAELARANKGSEHALSAWMSVVSLAAGQGLSGKIPEEALSTLTSDHVQAAEMAKLCNLLRYSAAIPEANVTVALHEIAEGSADRSIQAAALYSLGGVLGDGRAVGDPKIEKAKAVLAKLADYEDVEYFGGGSYAKAALSFVFALDNLVVGLPCPDFSAVDAEGAEFKLSDYKGKVVLVDFWGFW